MFHPHPSAGMSLGPGQPPNTSPCDSTFLPCLLPTWWAPITTRGSGVGSRGRAANWKVDDLSSCWALSSIRKDPTPSVCERWSIRWCSPALHDARFRHADPRYPFLWEDASQPVARWHGAGEVPRSTWRTPPMVPGQSSFGMKRLSTRSTSPASIDSCGWWKYRARLWNRRQNRSWIHGFFWATAPLIPRAKTRPYACSARGPPVCAPRAPH